METNKNETRLLLTSDEDNKDVFKIGLWLYVNGMLDKSKSLRRSFWIHSVGTTLIQVFIYAAVLFESREEMF